MYTIRKTFTFSAAHFLENLPEGHKCRRVHGHNFEVELELRAMCLTDGMIVDYGELSWFQRYLDETFDHRMINDVLGFAPTMEVLAKHLYGVANGRWPQVRAVRIKENTHLFAEYRDS
jgi:6-pyruvoyltetrahydropterin/6-carboxytetrahydropterin synthase